MFVSEGLTIKSESYATNKSRRTGNATPLGAG